MRLVACLAMCLILILANAAQTDAQAPSDPQAYCVNGDADFYPFTGEPCNESTLLQLHGSAAWTLGSPPVVRADIRAHCRDELARVKTVKCCTRPAAS
jgi:hypothetical protein